MPCHAPWDSMIRGRIGFAVHERHPTTQCQGKSVARRCKAEKLCNTKQKQHNICRRICLLARYYLAPPHLTASRAHSSRHSALSRNTFAGGGGSGATAEPTTPRETCFGLCETCSAHSCMHEAREPHRSMRTSMHTRARKTLHMTRSRYTNDEKRHGKHHGKRHGRQKHSTHRTQHPRRMLNGAWF